MANFNNDDRSKSASNRWTRLRQAYQSGELNCENNQCQSEQKRSRRNALADISTISRNGNTKNHKYQFQQLVERVRELQKEVVPEFLLYEIPSTYSSFSNITPSSTTSIAGPFQRQPSVSLNSVSSNPTIPNQRLSLSSRILKRAHDIPERFWIEWQEKQMQDQIEELEYIKNNIGCSPNSTLLSYGIDENKNGFSIADNRADYDEIRRRSLLYLHEATRLANKRRKSLLRQASVDETKHESLPKASCSLDDDYFSFDQRSEETVDAANLNDLNDSSIESNVPITPSQKTQSTLDRSRLSISLPFTYTNTREPLIYSNNSRSNPNESTLEKVVAMSDDIQNTNSINESPEDIAQIDTELNLTVLKRERVANEKSPLLYSKAIINRHIQFHKSRSVSFENNLTKINHLPICENKEINSNRSTSSIRSFDTVRSKFLSNRSSSDDRSIQLTSVKPSVVSFSRHSPSTLSHVISTVINYYDYDYNYPSLIQTSSPEYNNSRQNLSMTDVDDLKQKAKFSSTDSYSTTSNDEKTNSSRKFKLFINRHQSRAQRKRKSYSSNISLSSTLSFENNLLSANDLLRKAKEFNNKNSLNLTQNSSITSKKKIWRWKKNVGGFQRHVFSYDKTNVRRSFSSRSLSSSSSAAAATDCFLRRQPRKQTRLRRKTESKRRKKKREKKKGERNKKSPPSTTEAEASLFQYFTVDNPTIDTSTISYPYEQTRCADKSGAKGRNCFSIQTSVEQQQQQQQQQVKSESKSVLIMADAQTHPLSNSLTKKRENLRHLARRCRRTTKQQRKRVFLHSSSSSGNTHDINRSSLTNIEDLVSTIEERLNKENNSDNKKNNVIVVNYKPVFINSRQQKLSENINTPRKSIPKINVLPTDDEFSSATDYSRRRSLTTASSDGSPLRTSTTTYSHNQQSFPFDVPDVEDPLMFIEIMYQQLFTEDGRLRSGTEPTPFTNCLKQIVTNSRRNSISSSIANSSSSSRKKHKQSNSNYQQQRFSSSASSSPQLIPNNNYNTFSEEEQEEEEANTLVQTNEQQNQTKKLNSNVLKENSNNHSQLNIFLNSYSQKRTNIHRQRLSIDDTDDEDLDTFSDFNSTRFNNNNNNNNNNKTILTSPSVDDDLTHTDSRLLSSSGYQSLDQSRKYLKPLTSIQSKSHSENDLFYSLYEKNDSQIKYIHYCPNCIRPPNVTVIPPAIISTTSSTNLIQRIQQPLGVMLMKYLNFILISKNVLLIPLFIFLLRQRSNHVGNSNN